MKGFYNTLSKDYWMMLSFCKKDNNLNKAHIKFLENFFYNWRKKQIDIK
jgi:hypothetical protein